MDLLNNKWFQHFSIGLLFTLTLLTFAHAMNAFREFSFIGAGLEPKNTITVSGYGEVFAVPNIATFTLTVKKEARDPAEAQDLMAQKINSIVTFLKNEGINEKDLKTTNYNLSPRYEWKKDCSEFDRVGICDSKRELIGYEATQTIRVKVRDTKKAGALISGISSRGVDYVSGLSYEVDEQDELKREARDKAIQDAKEKAKRLASVLGVRLVRVVGYSESAAHIPAQPIYAQIKTAVINDSVEVAQMPVGENKINASVNITYEIR